MGPPGCCSSEAAVDVRVWATGQAGARVGTWWEVRGHWVEGAAAGPASTPEIEADELHRLIDPPSHREELP